MVRSIFKIGGLKQHWTSKHGVMKPKKAFRTLNDALVFIQENKINDCKYHPYVCVECGQWHIGHREKKR